MEVSKKEYKKMANDYKKADNIYKEVKYDAKKDYMAGIKKGIMACDSMCHKSMKKDNSKK